MTHVTCWLTAKNRDQLRNLRSVIEYRLPYYVWILCANMTKPEINQSCYCAILHYSVSPLSTMLLVGGDIW